MSEKKLKPQIEAVEINDWDHANSAIASIGIAQALIKESEARHEQIEQARKEQLAKEIAPHVANIEKLTNGLQAFAVAHREEFGKKKSRELVNGILGFRTSNPSVTQIPKFKKDVSIAIISQTDLADDLIRIKADINKESVLAKYSTGELDDKKLKEFGLRVEQDESFFIEVSESRIKKEAA